MTCKECLHYEACRDVYDDLAYKNKTYDFEFDEEDYARIGCLNFTDHSEWLHLPCEVGDFVYVIYGREIQPTTVFSIKVESENDHYIFYCKCIVHQGGARFEKFVFGKTVFLTHEEAEKALEGKK